MGYRSWVVRLAVWACAAACAGGLVGCSQAYHKQDADKEVYRIIEEKWQDQFGIKANYKVADADNSSQEVQNIPAVPDSGVLSLVEAVAMATSYNRDYQREKERMYLEVLDLTLERYEFMPQFFGTLGGDVNREARERFMGLDGEFGFNLLLAEGAQITTSIAADWLRFLIGDPRETLSSVLVATVVQPLLRGAGRKIVQENLTQAERSALYQIRAFSRFRQEFVVSIVTDYYRVLQVLNRVENTKNSYERLSRSKDRLEMLAKAGQKPQLEVDQAEQDKLKAWDTYISDQQRYEQLLDQFKIQLSLPTDSQIKLDPGELEGLEAAGITEPQISETDAIETALVRRLDLANDKDRVDDARRGVAVAADGLGTELNLVASASVGAPDEIRFGRIELNEGTYSLGLELDLPLDRKAERNAYRETLILLLQRRRAYEQSIDQVKLDVRQAWRDLREAAQRYKVQQESLKLALRRVASTKLLLEAGRASTRDLLESEAALLSAENRTTEALVDHTTAKLRFYRDIGILEVRNDGFWQIPAMDAVDAQTTTEVGNNSVLAP